MVLTSDSDDDFVSSPKDFWLFKNKAGPSSSNKKRKKQQPVKKSLTKSPIVPKKKKLKLDQNNENISNEEEPKTTNMENNSEPKFCSLCQMPFRSQSFTSLMADLCQDISRVSSFSRCLNGTFP